MSDAKPRVSKARIAYLGISLVLAIGAGVMFGDLLRTSDRPSEYIGVTFSILAGALFAVISIIGDPSMLLPGNARVGWESAKATQRDLQQFNYLFLIYLLTLALLVMSEMVESAGAESFYWLFNILAFLATLGFLLSLAIPSVFSKIQRERLADELKVRRGPKGTGGAEGGR